MTTAVARRPAIPSLMSCAIKRAFDIVVSILFLMVFCVPMVLIAVAVKFTSKGPIFHWSDRVGKDNRIFKMPKFRSMRIGTPQLATHLLQEPEDYLTLIGGMLRRTSMDELPQLFSVICGDLSLVGPRPALFNQHDLIALRTESGVHQLTPGITGWAQINGRDDLSIPEKVRLDREYLEVRSLFFDLKIIALTIMKVIKREGVSH